MTQICNLNKKKIKYDMDGYLYVLKNEIYKHYGDDVYKLGKTIVGRY